MTFPTVNTLRYSNWKQQITDQTSKDSNLYAFEYEDIETRGIFAKMKPALGAGFKNLSGRQDYLRPLPRLR